MPQRYHRICRCDDIADPGCHEFEIPLGAMSLNGFILHWQGRWFAYRNSCPHTGVALNWLPDQFFDIAREFIQCGVHGALFRPTDGLCLRGPCLGRSLESLGIELHDGEVMLDTESLAME